MNTGIHHQSSRPPCIEGQHPKTIDIRRVETEFVSQSLAVQRPAFDENRHAAMHAECGKPWKFLGKGDLEVMAWDGLVECKGAGLESWPRVGSVGVDSTRPVDRPRLGQ